MAKIKMVINFQESKNRRWVIAQMCCCFTLVGNFWICEFETFLFYDRGFNSLKLIPMSSKELLSWVRQ